ncbi:unnamed protein product, partial [Pylaiella littoralis]
MPQQHRKRRLSNCKKFSRRENYSDGSFRGCRIRRGLHVLEDKRTIPRYRCSRFKSLGVARKTYSGMPTALSLGRRRRHGGSLRQKRGVVEEISSRLESQKKKNNRNRLGLLERYIPGCLQRCRLDAAVDSGVASTESGIVGEIS